MCHTGPLQGPDSTGVIPVSNDEVLSEIRERLVRVETKIDSMNDVKMTADTAKAIATEALQDSRSAQRRIDDIEDNQRWLWRTTVGAIMAAVISAIIAAMSNIGKG